MTFSLKEDADRAIQELDGGSFGGGKRKIQVKWADERVNTVPKHNVCKN